MGALISLVYGTAVYVFFLCTFVYAIGFVGGVFVPKTVDSGTPAPLIEALAVNFLVLGIFAFQHSLMARRSFKRWWTQIVPPAVERSTYVLAATLALALLLWQWRPITEPVIWRIEDPAAVNAIWVIFWLGWACCSSPPSSSTTSSCSACARCSRACWVATFPRRSSARRCSTAMCATRSILASCSPSGRRR
jgi:hypothetical protein